MPLQFDAYFACALFVIVTKNTVAPAIVKLDSYNINLHGTIIFYVCLNLIAPDNNIISLS